jgi:hypothetical protein
MCRLSQVCTYMHAVNIHSPQLRSGAIGICQSLRPHIDVKRYACFAGCIARSLTGGMSWSVLVQVYRAHVTDLEESGFPVVEVSPPDRTDSQTQISRPSLSYSRVCSRIGHLRRLSKGTVLLQSAQIKALFVPARPRLRRTPGGTKIRAFRFEGSIQISNIKAARVHL